MEGAVQAQPDRVEIYDLPQIAVQARRRAIERRFRALPFKLDDVRSDPDVVLSGAAGTARPTVSRNTPTGTIQVSTPEVTLLDLVSMPHRAGGLSNVATVAGELLDDGAIDFAALATVAEGYPTAIAQRAGWLLDWVADELGSNVQLDALHHVAAQRTAPAPMLPGESGGALDDRWNVLVNTTIEPDL